MRGVAAGLERLAERLVLLEPRDHGPDGDGRDQGRRRIVGGTLVALGDGLAGSETGRIGVGRRDPGRVGFQPETLEGGADLDGRGMLAAGRGRRLARLGVDPVDLGQPIAGGGLELVRTRSGGHRGSEAALCRVLGLVHGARVRFP